MYKILAPRLSLQTPAWRQIGDPLQKTSSMQKAKDQQKQSPLADSCRWERSVYIAGGRQQTAFHIFVSSEVSTPQKSTAQKYENSRVTLELINISLQMLSII